MNTPLGYEPKEREPPAATPRQWLALVFFIVSFAVMLWMMARVSE